MGLFDFLRGRSNPGPAEYEQRRRFDEPSEDERALERYRYMLRTAPPEQIERAHEEAFAQLTPEQRQGVLRELSDQVPSEERTDSDDPRSLARLATRAELRQPGTVERSLRSTPAPVGRGVGFGGMLAGTMMGVMVGSFLGTAMAEQFFNDHPYDGNGFGGDQSDLGPNGGFDQGSDVGGSDSGGGGDFGGGDFGGGGD